MEKKIFRTMVSNDRVLGRGPDIEAESEEEAQKILDSFKLEVAGEHGSEDPASGPACLPIHGEWWPLVGAPPRYWENDT